MDLRLWRNAQGFTAKRPAFDFGHRTVWRISDLLNGYLGVVGSVPMAARSRANPERQGTLTPGERIASRGNLRMPQLWMAVEYLFGA